MHVILEILGVLALLRLAYTIRLGAVNVYGPVIHEFDPWFNFRSTQYLVENGYEKFSTWNDDQVWWPLGRPVGSTIYPGMMVTSAYIYQDLLPSLGYNDVSLNDVCVYIPAFGGALSSLFVYGIAREVTKDGASAVVSGLVMAIVPAHLMRSVAGGYDNESLAIPAICATFYFWVMALKKGSFLWSLSGILAGLWYGYLAATWGGYVFVVNMVGVHAAYLLLTGEYSARLWRAYTFFFLVGTYGALQVPIVGMAPFKSLEQLGPMGVFGLVQLWKIHEVAVKVTGGSTTSIAAGIGVAAVAGAAVAIPVVSAVTGIEIFSEVWAMSARVRALFIPHTRTGNPLVDSVAEHRAPGWGVYLQYFNIMVYFGIFGFFWCCDKPKTDAKSFIALYCFIAGYFSSKMIRLVVLLAPAVSVAGGLGIVKAINWCIHRVQNPYPPEDSAAFDAAKRAQFAMEDAEKKLTNLLENGVDANGKKLSGGELRAQEKVQRKATALAQEHAMKLIAAYKAKNSSAVLQSERNAAAAADGTKKPAAATKEGGDGPDRGILDDAKAGISDWFSELGPTRMTLVYSLSLGILIGSVQFYSHATRMAGYLSEPQIIVRNSSTGEIVDDFREAYFHIRDNTPKDARVMAWWDYGYQINGMAERTTIADGNTWNHEHIALLGKALVSNEDDSHEIIKHMADYVLLWTTHHAGMWGDDLAKQPHMARIAGSVFSDVDASMYRLGRDKVPSPMMAESVLYKLHSYGIENANPKVDELTHYEEFYTTKNKMVRVYKVKDVDAASKAHPVGSYPPALQDVVDKMKPFGSD